MNSKKIEFNSEEYALIIDGSKIPDGLKFYTSDDKFVQVASWKYEEGKTLDAHSHKICERTSNVTQEVVIVKKGSIKVKIFNNDEELIAEEIIKEGDILIQFQGGHEYEILEDDTEVFEVKNGPYPGLEKDKKVIGKKDA
jgi:hypothetical protein